MDGSSQFGQHAITNLYPSSSSYTPPGDQQSHYTMPSYANDIGNNSDEWEYEYSKTETEVFFIYSLFVGEVLS